jgi:hypothetical protein
MYAASEAGRGIRRCSELETRARKLHTSSTSEPADDSDGLARLRHLT